MESDMRSTILALVLATVAVPALAQGSGGGSSMPGTAGVNPGAVSRETLGGTGATGSTQNKDTSNAGTAGQYTGTTNSGTGSSPLGTNPMSGSPTAGGGTGAAGGTGSAR
jgi:hypothetical protein